MCVILGVGVLQEVPRKFILRVIPLVVALDYVVFVFCT